LTVWLLLKGIKVTGPNDKRVTARTPAAPNKFEIAEVSAFSSMKDHTRYTEFCYSTLSTTILGNLYVYELPMLLDGRSEICVMSEKVTRELILGWKHANFGMITADGNQVNLRNVADSLFVDVDGIVILVPIISAKSLSKQVIRGHPCEIYDRRCARNLDDGRCKITISAIDG
jgi:hypothetical protein